MNWNELAADLDLAPSLSDGVVWWHGQLNGEHLAVRLAGPVDAPQLESVRIDGDFPFTLLPRALRHLPPKATLPPNHADVLGDGQPLLYPATESFRGLTARTALQLMTLQERFGVIVSHTTLEVPACGCAPIRSVDGVRRLLDELTQLVTTLTGRDPLEREARDAELTEWLAGSTPAQLAALGDGHLNAFIREVQSPVKVYRAVGLTRFLAGLGDQTEPLVDAYIDSPNDEHVALGWLCRFATGHSRKHASQKHSQRGEFAAALALCDAAPEPIALDALLGVYRYFHRGNSLQLRQLADCFHKHNYFAATPWIVPLIDWIPDAACYALGRCGDERAIPALEKLAGKLFGGDDKRNANAALVEIRARTKKAAATGGLTLSTDTNSGGLSVSGD